MGTWRRGERRNVIKVRYGAHLPVKTPDWWIASNRKTATRMDGWGRVGEATIGVGMGVGVGLAVGRVSGLVMIM